MGEGGVVRRDAVMEGETLSTNNAMILPGAKLASRAGNPTLLLPIGGKLTDLQSHQRLMELPVKRVMKRVGVGVAGLAGS